MCGYSQYIYIRFSLFYISYSLFQTICLFIIMNAHHILMGGSSILYNMPVYIDLFIIFLHSCRILLFCSFWNVNTHTHFQVHCSISASVCGSFHKRKYTKKNKGIEETIEGFVFIVIDGCTQNGLTLDTIRKC